MNSSIQDAARFLREQETAVISTINAAGHPSAATVYFMADDDCTIYFPTRATSRKYAHIQSRPHVACTVSSTSLMQTLQIEGTAYEVTDPLITVRLIERLIHSSSHHITSAGRWLPPIKQLRDGHFAVIAVTPTWIRFADFSDNDPSADSRYTVILDTTSLE